MRRIWLIITFWTLIEKLIVVVTILHCKLLAFVEVGTIVLRFVRVQGEIT